MTLAPLKIYSAMVYSNKNSVSKIKNTLLMTGVILLISATVFILLENFVIVAIIAGFFLLGLICLTILNFQYVRIMDENNRLIIRYYSIFLVNRQYESIEFPIGSLRNVEVVKFFFGLKWDVRFTVRIKQGMADYPPVCFSAIPFAERKKLVNSLRRLIAER
jgi:hypothetical protein